MKNHEVEKKLKKAYSKIEAPDLLNSVLSDYQTQKGYVYMEKKNNTWKLGLAMCVAALLMIGGISGFNHFNSNLVTSTIAFDVNPSIELEMNKNEEVLKVNALNEDAIKVLDGMNLVGSDMDVAVNALIGSMIKQGYLSELTNSILVSVNSNDQAVTNELQKKLMEEINELIKENNLTGSVLSQKIQLDDEEIEELANVYGITKGKTQLIKEILKTNPYHSFEDLVNLSINELNLISQSKQDTMENVTVSGTASDKKYIGVQKAKEIALEKANLKENQVLDLDVELDYEMGTMIYEVEFEYNQLDYDFDIKATDGTILHMKENVESSKTSQPVENISTSYIGKEKAKEIVFNHANVKESQVTNLWIEMDSDDGQMIYEVEFNVGSKEYDYEVSATSGKVIDYDVETDDDKEDVVTNTQTSTTTISKDKAKSIALTDANVTASQISNYEIELDEGKYEISFNANNKEYDYEISSTTGKILNKEVETDEKDSKTTSTTTQTSTTAISKDKAKSIALTDANLTTSQITNYEIELDEGKYEISFNANNQEYDYEISSTTGDILNKEVEKED